MNEIVAVQSLQAGDRFEFITARSEWDDNCFLPHPKGIVVVAKSAFIDVYKQCRFGWRLEKFPDAKPQDWWGLPQTEVRLLGNPPQAPAVDVKLPLKKTKSVKK